MSNDINTVKSNVGIIAKAAAAELVDNLQFAKTIGQADPSDYKGKNGYSAGDTIYISKPARFIPGSTFDITSGIQDVKEEKVALALDIVSSVGISLDSQELASTMELSSVYNRAVKPAIKSIAQTVEQTLISRGVIASNNVVGTPGSTVFDTDLMLQAGQKLTEFLAPMDDERFALLSPAATRSAVTARKGLFQNAAEVGKQYKMGAMGQADGFTYLSNNLMPRITNGADVAFAVEASVVTIANGMSTLGVDGVTSGATIKAGTKFTIASCYAVHPITKANLGYLQQFTVLADVTETASNQVTLSISPAIYYTAGDPRQNVNTAPVDEDVCTVATGSASTTYTHNLAYHKDAFRMVSVPLVMPEAVEFAEQATYKGFTVAIVRAFDVLKRRMITRVDFLGGFAATRPEWACDIIA